MSNQLFPAVLLFGAPGVGKGTQGKLLSDVRGLFHVSTGDIFRNLGTETEDGKQVAELLSRGELVPGELTVRVWRLWLNNQIARGNYIPDKAVLLMDGIPRTVRQCELLQDIVMVHRIIHLKCADEQPLVERIKMRAITDGRADDADEEVIRHRFHVYHQETEPVLNFYDSNRISEIDPIGTPTEVLTRILQDLIPRVKDLLGEDAVSGEDAKPERTTECQN